MGQATSGRRETIGHELKHRAIVHGAEGDVIALGTAFTRAGTLTEWQFFNCNKSEYATGDETGRPVTPLLLRRTGDGGLEVVAVGRTRKNAASGTQTFPFDAVEGTAVVWPGTHFGWRHGEPATKVKGCIECDHGGEQEVFQAHEAPGEVRPGSSFAFDRYARTYSIRAVADAPAEGAPLDTRAGLHIYAAELAADPQKRAATVELRIGRDANGPDEVAVTLCDAKKTAQQTVRLSSNKPSTVRLELKDLAEGEHLLDLVITDRAGAELFALRRMSVNMPSMARILPGLSFFTTEPEGFVYVEPKRHLTADAFDVVLLCGGKTIAAETVRNAPRIRVPFDLALLPQGDSRVTCRVLIGGATACERELRITKLPPKPNEVKIDYASRGLIAGGLPFLPCGFFTLYPHLAESIIAGEAINGLNMISPYQQPPYLEVYAAEKIPGCRKYMDRCAEVGMKVNYHLLWFIRAKQDEKDWAHLREEIELVRDHPALLCYYLDDEPALWNNDPAMVGKIYDFIREHDPYHPVTICFTRPHEAFRYRNAMDIAMVDPYPIPKYPVTWVPDRVDTANISLDSDRPVWIVPQAASGCPRSPSRVEERVMTYLGLIHGSKGMQYFIRTTDSISTPQIWSACREIAAECTQLVSALLSREPRPPVTISPKLVRAAAWRDRGVVTVLAANTENEPKSFQLRIDGVDYTGPAALPFENRKIDVKGGVIEDMIDGYGTRAYAVPAGPFPEDDLAAVHGACITNSFETSAHDGLPLGCAFARNDDMAASCFVDPRVARHGRQSVRICVSGAGAGSVLSFFGSWVTPGKSYRLSVWAKAASPGVTLRLAFSKMESEAFDVGTEWRELSFTGAPACDTAYPALTVKGTGTVWLDLLQLAEVKD